MTRTVGKVKGRDTSAHSLNIASGSTGYGRPGARPRIRLNKNQAIRLSDAEHAAEKERRLVASRRERRALEELRLPAAGMDLDDRIDDYEEAILRGDAQMDISAAGEVPLGDLLHPNELSEMYAAYLSKHGSRVRKRNRRGRGKLIVDGFEAQIQDIADTWEAWELFAEENGPNAKFMAPEGATVQSEMSVYVIDIFEGRWASVPFFAGDSTIAPSLVRQGLFPCTPYFATVVFTARTLNAFHSLRMRCPRLGKQAFLRSISDMHGVAPRPYLQTQFSAAYDLSLRVKDVVRLRVAQLLGRDGPNWRLENACAACLYKVEGEAALDPPFFLTMDGNNSLKRVERREGYTTADGVKVSGESVEAIDDRAAPRDYYIPAAEVDRFAKGGGEELLKGFLPDPKWAEEKDGCGDGWHNMKEHITQKARGVYGETGLFGAFCRHSVCLLICDMIRSGELAKYGLAATFHLLSVLGKYRLGYDIGCKFEQWVYTHPLTALAALEHGFEAVVGAFHGTGHKRLCQVRKMPIYTTGSGLEAFENMESVFSKSNALAGTTRHASRFHRQRDIVEYFAHADNFDALAGITSLMDSKYRRALQVLARADQLLEAMDGLGLDRADKSVFSTWLDAERAALEKLPTDPPEETLQMEYYRKLVDLGVSQDNADQVLAVRILASPPMGSPEYDEFNKRTRKEEAERRRVLDRHERCITVVEDLERRLDIGAGERWTPGSEEWVAVATLTREYQYRKSLDQLQGLIVSRLLELSKANMVETAYKMRKHIAKAIQARSKSLKTALARYNAAAENLGDRPVLTWEEILEMGRLEDFDLLRLAREDIRDAAWAQPGARPTLDLYFKLLRAEEERYHECRLKEEGQAARALQVHKYRMQQGRFYGLHQDRLLKLSRLPGFTGSIEPGVGLCRIRRAVLEHGDAAPATEEPVAGVEAALAASAAAENETGGDDGGAQDVDDPSDDEADTDAGFEAVLNVAEDRHGVEEGGQ
ncbi:hypothetical protein B0H16DRAFT_1724512 [Mycena metata]|uniref:CxC1-like cysteine cluster associated with KDZ transposases domain-containing protein n=1 Tax=Mycena metata TaxID=1033252 RepID=A0AAD7IVE6_9AGAR|nr:hypothetical protein B0H16DRAFT_1724512 [Mycena metata]